MTGGRGRPAEGDFPHVDADGGPSDSAGQAWAGKSIPTHGFSGDTGEAAPGLVEVLRVLEQAPTPETESAAMRAIADARWLVPVLAVATELTEQAGSAGVSDTRTEMATVTLTAPDGSRALPMFSSLAALAEWDASARPVAVPAVAAARAAVGEGCDVLVLDVASAHAVVLRSSMLWALAEQRTWHPSHLDPDVASALERACRDEPAVRTHRLEAGEPAGAGLLRVVLGVHPGLQAEQISAIAARLGEQIASDEQVRARIDALAFALEAAG
ncbi:MAG: SseB family protein [Intrasporangium sp.]|uniref:SseB family protein n=1 Tax=Intrasporangium sp. TaxID=1925024 RepID=UPI002647A93F|nr:SseB family protein [Intrasporangium sp.]MDN5796349.1 SseB family protein [Intrasporangium sp.]